MIVERRYRFAACALLFLGAFTLFFWPVLFGGRVPVFRDVLDTTLPLGQYIGARLREGKLPQWFPFEGLGEPFIGQLNESTFHPTSWLYAVLPLTTALRWEMLLGYLAGGFGQLLFARKLGLSWTASALAAVAFAFSGYELSMSNLLPYLWGTVTLSWLGYFAAEVYTSERPWPWVAALAMCWASIVLTGDSHSALFGGVVALIAGVLTRRLRRLPLCILAAAIAIGLSGAELLPAIDIVRAGPRVAWNDVAWLSSRWSLHPYRLPELIFPNWLPLATSYMFSNFRYHEGGMWALSIYASTPVVALAFAGCFQRSRRAVVATGVALLAVWLASGIHGGLEPLIRTLLPFLKFLRTPEKHLGLWTLLLPLGAAAGLDSFRESPRRAVVVAIGIVAAACAIAGLALPADVAQRVWPDLSATPEDIPLVYDAWRTGLLSAAVSLGALAGLLAAAQRLPRLIVLAPLIALCDLGWANRSVIGLGDESLLTSTPRFCASARAHGATVSGLRAMNVSSRTRKIEEMNDANVWAALSLNQLLPGSNTLCGFGAVSNFHVLSNEPRAVRAMFGNDHLELNPAAIVYGFGILVRAFPEDKPIPGENVIDSLTVLPGQELLLVERPAAPRAYAAVPRWVPDPAAARREILDHGMAVVDSPVLAGTGPSFAGSGKAGEVKIATYEPEHVVLEAQMSKPGAVILNDLAAHGWTATVDGAPATIHHANAIVRGVLVGEGSHRIEMRYQLPRLREGIAVSLGSLLVCALLVLLRRKREAA